ncbi:hypothetical protein NFJ02_02g71430 [Pycnococcus provasolii]
MFERALRVSPVTAQITAPVGTNMQTDGGFSTSAGGGAHSRSLTRTAMPSSEALADSTSARDPFTTMSSRTRLIRLNDVLSPTASV